MYPGESDAWKNLLKKNVEEVVTQAGVRFDRSEGCFEVDSLNHIFLIYPLRQEIRSNSPSGQILLKRLNYFLKPVLLNYLLQAKNIPLSGDYVTPSSLSGGETFFRGSHELPFERLALLFELEKEKLERIALNLGGMPAEFGDFSFKLFPLPKVPVVLVFWRGDEEFPAEAKIMYDKTVKLHLPVDLIWSVSMYTLLAFLIYPEV